MILRIILIVVCLQATVISFGQTDAQKQMMYEHINRDAKGNVVLPKTESFNNKEELFKKAQVLPVYQVVFDKENKPKLIKKDKYYLVFYIGRLYVFAKNNGSRLFENSPIIQNLIKFNSENKKFKIVFFTESFSFDREILNPLFTDDALSFIIDKETKYTLLDFISFKYGSIEKLKEYASHDASREKLTLKDYNSYLKSNYSAFEYNCPKDTTLVLKSLVNQIRIATKDFSKGQELKLINKIREKLNPFEKELIKKLKEQKLNDSIIKTHLLELKKINDENQKNLSKVTGNYEFKVYGISITNELLEIFTNKQLVDYLNFINVMKPALDTLVIGYNNKYRYSYGIEILQKEGIVKQYDNVESGKYTQKILEECGCPFDTTIKREIIIR